MLKLLWMFMTIGWPAPQPAVNEHLTYGSPEINTPGRQLIIREGYALLHDEDKKDPLWVSYHLTSAYTVKTAKRKDHFRPDPELKPGLRAELDDYKASSWSRGHMCPANDSTRSKKVMDECFYLSNMVPQNQQNNGGIWARLESTANSYAKSFGDVTIITGPIFDKPLPGGATQPDPIGESKVAVPTWLFKIIIRKDSGGAFRVLAFEVPNQPVKSISDAQLKKFLVSVRQIEKDTNLNFLNALSKTVQDKIETKAATDLWSASSP